MAQFSGSYSDYAYPFLPLSIDDHVLSQTHQQSVMDMCNIPFNDLDWWVDPTHNESHDDFRGQYLNKDGLLHMFDSAIAIANPNSDTVDDEATISAATTGTIPKVTAKSITDTSKDLDILQELEQIKKDFDNKINELESKISDNFGRLETAIELNANRISDQLITRILTAENLHSE